jgi:hypothetical protein
MLEVGATGIEETAFILVLNSDPVISSFKNCKMLVLVQGSSSE